MTTILEAKFDVEHRSSCVFVTVRVNGPGVAVEGEFRCESIGPAQIADLFRALADSWMKFSAAAALVENVPEGEQDVDVQDAIE